MQYLSQVTWNRNEVPFTVKTFDRTHTIRFNGGASMEASSAPEYLGKAELPNPEEMFTASLASCFSLTFLYWAAVKNLALESFSVKAAGTLAKNSEGKMAMTEVVLTPEVKLADANQADDALLRELFQKAHDQCFISSSVKTKVTVNY